MQSVISARRQRHQRWERAHKATRAIYPTLVRAQPGATKIRTQAVDRSIIRGFVWIAQGGRHSSHCHRAARAPLGAAAASRGPPESSAGEVARCLSPCVGCQCSGSRTVGQRAASYFADRVAIPHEGARVRGLGEALCAQSRSILLLLRETHCPFPATTLDHWCSQHRSTAVECVHGHRRPWPSVFATSAKALQCDETSRSTHGGAIRSHCMRVRSTTISADPWKTRQCYPSWIPVSLSKTSNRSLIVKDDLVLARECIVL